MNVDKSNAILRWQEAQLALHKAIAEENEARLALVAMAFPTPNEGTNNVDLGQGWTLRGVFRNNYNLDKTKVEDVLKLLPPAVARALVGYKPELKQGAYKALEPAHKMIVNEIVTITPGLPALELVPPKVTP